MRLLLNCPLILLFFFCSPCLPQQLQCYHCINRLSTTDITKQEQNALKSALFNRFNIPPSSEYCADGGSDILFRTVSKEVCQGENDTCVRIVSQGDDTKKLVLRGCQSTLLKANFELDTNYSCGKAGGPAECITTCQAPLCNISHATIPLIMSLLVVAWCSSQHDIFN